MISRLDEGGVAGRHAFPPSNEKVRKVYVYADAVVQIQLDVCSCDMIKCKEY